MTSPGSLGGTVGRLDGVPAPSPRRLSASIDKSVAAEVRTGDGRLLRVAEAPCGECGKTTQMWVDAGTDHQSEQSYPWWGRWLYRAAQVAMAVAERGKRS